MSLAYAALLGVIQGLTEFLPISSSAHLILARAVFGWDVGRFGLAFDVACHVGTLLAVFVYFRDELRAMAGALPALFGSSPPARLARLIAIGTVPIVMAGALFSDLVEQSLRTPAVATTMLAVGALALLAVERIGAPSRNESSLTPLEALALGAAQATALVPGVSRSGATIAVGMLVGLRRDAAARFAFLLGVPAVLAAAVKESIALAGLDLSREVALLFVVGLASSAVVGYFTVKYFVRYLARHTLDVFAVYRLVLASSMLIWQAGVWP